MKASFNDALAKWQSARGGNGATALAIEELEGEGGGGTAVAARPETALSDGAVVIAAITSCTNTSNPSVMIAAGLLARNARKRGLRTKPWVKTSLAPGSKVVTDYLERAGLQGDLDALGFNLVGYGCTTCIGNSGPLPLAVADAVVENDFIVAAVLSGNRNFEGRIHPHVRANYLASPPLVVAYALAGRMDVDLTTEPLGLDEHDKPVYLRDVWPSNAEIAQVVGEAVTEAMYTARYGDVFSGDEAWRAMPVPTGERYAWDPHSEYVKRPPYFDGMPAEPVPPRRHQRRARPRRARRQRDDRPHLAGGVDRPHQPGRPLPRRTRRGPGGLQLVRRPARQPRGHDARHVRQYAVA